MKNNKFVTILIIFLIIAIIGVFGFLVYTIFSESEQTNSNIEQQQTNQATDNNSEQTQNNVNNLSSTNNTTNTNNTNNEQMTNQTTIEPIIDNNISNPSTTQDKETFATTYYYNQLNANAKIIYDGLKANKENLISGNYIINYGTKFNTLLNSEGGEEKLNKDFQSAWNAFSYDNVELFYIDPTKITLTNEYHSLGGIKTYKISIGPGNNTYYYKDTFNAKEQADAAKSYLENIKKQMIEQTAADDTYTKIAKIHNWLIYFISYENNENSKDQYTIYGALKNGKAVCEGYSRAFKYLMDGIGVPCVLVSGTGTNSQGQTETHAWNYVQINEKWYAVDVTWDDPVVTGGVKLINEMKYKYFLKGSKEFFKEHKENGNISEGSMTFKFPTLDTKDYKK